jgi:hypothetical protein
MATHGLDSVLGGIKANLVIESTAAPMAKAAGHFPGSPCSLALAIRRECYWQQETIRDWAELARHGQWREPYDSG